jgi:hypothetical protein
MSRFGANTLANAAYAIKINSYANDQLLLNFRKNRFMLHSRNVTDSPYRSMRRGWRDGAPSAGRCLFFRWMINPGGRP